jgi:uncharacterized protein (DUF1919 family)
VVAPGLKSIISAQVNKIQRERFRLKLNTTRNRNFSLISSNCLGATFYQLLNLPYATPTVGLFFFAPCFVKFISNLEGYLQEELIQVDFSQYDLGNKKRDLYNHYPLGKLGDIEIHFMHYSSWDEVLHKWNRRVNRINFSNLFFMMTDQELCSVDILQAFDQLPYPKKVCFTAKKHELASCIQIPKYAEREEVGNLVANYQLLYNRFDFPHWFDD